MSLREHDDGAERREELTERPAVLLAEATGREPGFFANGEDDVPAFEDLTLEDP